MREPESTDFIAAIPMYGMKALCLTVKWESTLSLHAGKGMSGI